MAIEDLQESEQRQGILEHFKVIHSSPTKDFDDISLLTAQVCNTPIAVIQIVEEDESWTKSSFGIEKEQVPENPSFWEPTLEHKKLLMIEAIDQNADFSSFENLEGFSFYAGIPLITPEEIKCGVLYVLDYTPRVLDERQKKSLTILANQLLSLLDSRKKNMKLKEVQKRLEQKYHELERFASVVSHDIKSPLANIISLTELIKEENEGKLGHENEQYLDFLAESSYNLRNYVDGILSFYRSDHLLNKERGDVVVAEFFKNITRLFQVNNGVQINFPTSGVLYNVNKAALTQIFLNLISNALKHNQKHSKRIDIHLDQDDAFYYFQVIDNGKGIPPEDAERIFDLFTTLEENDSEGKPGSGIGLATVKKLVDNLEGAISVESNLNEGSNFRFKIKRK